MAANRKIEVEFKVKCSAEKFYSMMTRDALKLPKYVPRIIHNVQVVSGEDNKPFGVRMRAKITAMDHQNMSLTFTVVDGYLSDDYTSFSNTLTITTPTQRDGNYNCVVKWSEDLTKELDANLLKEG
ncbi:hypothetical protein C5167_035507 [Papaver somniferum]|uniref:Bet v I/Major latex protein domain-containing protein n=1 Tax=Papaver somniferum TaxID=3469 RepID=A0A4Y7KJT8_PAPSO|nr:hypothetical protein C5167_035507 [Papaver somniferum]